MYFSFVQRVHCISVSVRKKCNFSVWIYTTRLPCMIWKPYLLAAIFYCPFSEFLQNQEFNNPWFNQRFFLCKIMSFDIVIGNKLSTCKTKKMIYVSIVILRYHAVIICMFHNVLLVSSCEKRTFMTWLWYIEVSDFDVWQHHRKKKSIFSPIIIIDTHKCEMSEWRQLHNTTWRK